MEDYLARRGDILPPKYVTPLSSNCAPCLEDFPELMADGVHQYQELIGHLRWDVDIVRLDMMLEMSLLSSYLVMPRFGHLKQVFHIFGYLRAHPKKKLGFDLAHTDINKNRFHQFDWTEFYRDAEEVIPRNIPVARGNFMSTHFSIDTNHARDTETGQSQAGIFLFCNSAPIIWFRKR